MYSGDPKRPKNITYYSQPQAEEQTDMIQFLSMIFGIVSFILKVKWGIWLSLIFIGESVVYRRYCKLYEGCHAPLDTLSI